MRPKPLILAGHEIAFQDEKLKEIISISHIFQFVGLNMFGCKLFTPTLTLTHKKLFVIFLIKLTHQSNSFQKNPIESKFFMVFGVKVIFRYLGQKKAFNLIATFSKKFKFYWNSFEIFDK